MLPPAARSGNTGLRMFNLEKAISTQRRKVRKDVPYKGAAPALVDVLSGQVSMKFDNAFAVPYFKAGKLRLLGVSGLKRVGIKPQ